MDLQRIFEFVAVGRREADASPQAGAHLEAIEMHPPMGGVGRWRQVLGLGPVDEEVGQCLRLDGGAALIVERVGANSMAHLATRPDASRLPMISASGAVQTTVIGCSWK